MNRNGLLELNGNTCKMGDLNLMLENKETMSYPAIDPENPARPFFTGYIPMKAGDREFGVYIPEEYPISGAGFYVWMPGNETAEEFILSSGLKELSEKYQAALILLQSNDGGWDKDSIQAEIDYSLNVFKTSIARKYFSLNESTYYILGIKEGAYIAAAFGFLHSEFFSSLLLDGDYHLSAGLIEQLKGLYSDRNELQKKTDVAVPAWLVSDDIEKPDEICEILTNAANLTYAIKHKDLVVYKEDLRQTYTYPDRAPIIEVRVTAESKYPDKIELYDRMFGFALYYKRWLGIGNGDFRPARSYEDMSLKRHEKMIDGRKREWYCFIPSEHKKCPDKKLPLVLAIHGYSCTGLFFAENSHWHEVGERRDFFVVYVSAFPSNKAFGNTTVPLPTWNSVGMASETDDIAYIEEVLSEVKSSLPIDEERIYVSGHSNGSLMTQKLMAERAKEFAAFGPQGAQFHMDVTGDEAEKKKALKRDIAYDGIIRPVWLMMGEDDIGVGGKIEKGNPNDLFIDMMCRLNGLDREKDSFLQNGKYATHTFTDASNVPLLKFSEVKNLPHAYTPEMAWTYWDQFFCHFKRRADGSIEYIP